MENRLADELPLLLPDEVVTEILSRLSVKSLVRFWCVSKSWRSLISDPIFVKLHLQRSHKYAKILLTSMKAKSGDSCVVPCSMRSLKENPSSIATDKDGGYPLRPNYVVLGSVNGLVCLCGVYDGYDLDYESWGVCDAYRVRFWNPSTRSTYRRSRLLIVNTERQGFRRSDEELRTSIKFGFGYDDSSDAYKVVAVLFNSGMNEIFRVHSKGESCWRKISSFPAFPILREVAGQFVSGTLNWLAIRAAGSSRYDWDTVTVNQLVIFSLHLGTETHKQLSMPDGLDHVPKQEPSLAVLRDCLCLFYDDYEDTRFVVWQMKEFGVKDSWTQLVNFSYRQLKVMHCPSYPCVPLCISENGEDVLISNRLAMEVVIYNLRDNRVERNRNPDNIIWSAANAYVQSLVSPY